MLSVVVVSGKRVVRDTPRVIQGVCNVALWWRELMIRSALRRAAPFTSLFVSRFKLTLLSKWFIAGNHLIIIIIVKAIATAIRSSGNNHLNIHFQASTSHRRRVRARETRYSEHGVVRDEKQFSMVKLLEKIICTSSKWWRASSSSPSSVAILFSIAASEKSVSSMQHSFSRAGCNSTPGARVCISCGNLYIYIYTLCRKCAKCQR